jgi:hypothetical protein
VFRLSPLPPRCLLAAVPIPPASEPDGEPAAPLELVKGGGGLVDSMGGGPLKADVPDGGDDGEVEVEDGE